jgi:hypothetical protein
MPLPVIPDIWRCALNWETSSQHAVNVIHVSDNVGTRDAADIAVTLDFCWQSGQFEPVAAGAQITSYDLIKLDGTTATTTVPTSGPSGGGGSEWIPAASALVSFQTGLRGRDHRGRMYLPFLAETKQNDGVISVTSGATYQGHWDAWVALLIAQDLPLVVASYKDAEATTVSAALVRFKAATQRRRQQRV